MFYMVSENGNAHRKVKSERKRDELIALGYHEVKVPAEEERGVEDVAPYDGPQQADEPQRVDDPLQMHTTEDDAQDAATEEGAQAAAGGDNTTEDDAQAEANPKKRKTKKNAAEE